MHELGEPAGVVQLLDRHGRDCATVARGSGVPLHVTPRALSFSLQVVWIPGWHEVAAFLDGRVLVVGDALGTASYFLAPGERLAVHPLLRLFPPRGCAASQPEHVLCGHGEGVHGRDAADGARPGAAHGPPPDPALAAGVDQGVAEPMRTLVFIPAWNEAENLPAVLEELHGELPDVDVLVVDDGSTDATAELAREAGAEVLSFGENRGLRAAIAAGYGYAAEHGYELVGRLDADGQHPAAELRRLLERVEAGEADAAVGSRFVAGEGYDALPLPAEPRARVRHRAPAQADAAAREGRHRRRDERPLRRQRARPPSCSRSRTRAARRRSRA